MNILNISRRSEFRKWLIDNAKEHKDCYLIVKIAKPGKDTLTYLDAVEEALCFGYIDSVKKCIDGVTYQRFSPRNKKSYWSELNKERVRRLIKLNLMDELGYKVLPKLGPRSYKLDIDVEKALKKNRCYKIFKSFHPLYQRVRSYNVSFYKNIDKETYKRALNHLILETKLNKMFGNWNDYGRLLDY